MSSFQLNKHLNMVTHLLSICITISLLSKYFLEGGLFPLSVGCFNITWQPVVALGWSWVGVRHK